MLHTDSVGGGRKSSSRSILRQGSVFAMTNNEQRVDGKPVPTDICALAMLFLSTNFLLEPSDILQRYIQLRRFVIWPPTLPIQTNPGLAFVWSDRLCWEHRGFVKLKGQRRILLLVYGSSAKAGDTVFSLKYVRPLSQCS